MSGDTPTAVPVTLDLSPEDAAALDFLPEPARASSGAPSALATGESLPGWDDQPVGRHESATSEVDWAGGLPVGVGAAPVGSVTAPTAGGRLEAGAPPPLPDRYTDLGLLGLGGMGEVRRVRDRSLNRVLAMKIIRPELAHRRSVTTRFLGEAQATAQLQHPGVVPVHESGTLADGRVFFTMKEVRGRTLSDIYALPGDHPDRWSRGRLLDAWRRVCEAVGHAHARGVVHRDLKPANVMVGAHGEVLVLDWGLAKVTGLSTDDEPVQTVRSGDDALTTRDGAVAGTPAYMAPEQALGRNAAVGPRADVYALGLMLYEILAGRRAYPGDNASDVLDAVHAGPPPPLTGPGLSSGLVAICNTAIARDPARRFPDALALATEVVAWQDGALKRERALRLVREAEAMLPEVDALVRRARSSRSLAARQSLALAQWAPLDRKRPVWALEDAAEELTQLAEEAEFGVVQRLHGALTHSPELPEAHRLLADVYRARHARAEADHDARDARRFALLLRAHDDGRHAEYLDGLGIASVHTLPKAKARLFRFERQDRRLVPVFVRDLGLTPVESLRLAIGSYLVELRAPGREVVRLPLSVERTGDGSSVRPGDTAPLPIPLPLLGSMRPDERYVPPGWCWLGGDPSAFSPLPRQRAWVDGFIARRFPVTNREYLTFLNDLVESGRADEAELCVPRVRVAGGAGSPVYGLDSDGRYLLRPDADGDLWDPDWPVLLVDWNAADRFARWCAARTGLPWRLPGEAEWEKAARGVDGRFLPWGDHLEPTWACVRGSRRGRPLPAKRSEFPIDESVYGLRGMAGGVSEWCGDAFAPEGPVGEDGVALPPHSLPEDAAAPRRVLRGGAWSFTPGFARLANRRDVEAGFLSETVGFRLVRSWVPPGP